MTFVHRFINDEKGLETVEYGVMTALILGALIIALVSLGTAVTDRMENTADTLNGN
jgi:Flp pilus assembly pilin Flp